MKSVHRFFPSCFLVVALVLTAAPGGVQSQSAPRSGDAQRLIGTWRLASYESTDQESMRTRGAQPIGLLFYDGTGHMAAQIMPDRARRRFTGPVSPIFAGPQPTADEALDAVKGYAAYFGTYTVDEQSRTVTHHRLANLNPGALGDFVRRYEFAGDDRMTLIPLDSPNLRTARLTWARVN
jgi:Lipocalin-like domain